jgi:hypothetical protein
MIGAAASTGLWAQTASQTNQTNQSNSPSMASASASGDISRFIISPYALHYSRSPEHRHVWLIGMEQESPDKSIRGAAYFSNSFGQDSVYIFPWGGRYDNLFGASGLYAKWSAGLLYGYKKPYEDKVPFNHRGFSPGIIPVLGYQFSNRLGAEMQFLGTAGVMFSMTYRYE